MHKVCVTLAKLGQETVLGSGTDYWYLIKFRYIKHLIGFMKWLVTLDFQSPGSCVSTSIQSFPPPLAAFVSLWKEHWAVLSNQVICDANNSALQVVTHMCIKIRFDSHEKLMLDKLGMKIGWLIRVVRDILQVRLAIASVCETAQQTQMMC